MSFHWSHMNLKFNWKQTILVSLGKPMTNFANREYEGSPDTCLQYICPILLLLITFIEFELNKTIYAQSFP